MLEYASRIGVDRTEFLEALREVPAMSSEQFQRVADAHYAIAHQLSTSAYQNLQQARFIAERRTAEDELRQAEEKYWKAFNTSPVWVIISTLEEGRFIEVNDAFLKATGFSREEVLGRTSRNLQTCVKPDDRAGILEEVNRNGFIKNNEVDRRTKSGSILTTLFFGERMELHGEKCLLSVSLD
jgi:PAS domain S-box-containing protein